MLHRVELSPPPLLKAVKIGHSGLQTCFADKFGSADYLNLARTIAITHDASLFVDGDHLNKRGSKRFSEVLKSRLGLDDGSLAGTLSTRTEIE